MTGAQGGKRGPHLGLEEAGCGIRKQRWRQSECPEEAPGLEEAGRLHTRISPCISSSCHKLLLCPQSRFPGTAGLPPGKPSSLHQPTKPLQALTLQGLQSLPACPQPPPTASADLCPWGRLFSWMCPEIASEAKSKI